MDGFGWLIDKLNRLEKTYGKDQNYWLFEITSAQGWVKYNWAVENEACIWGRSIERSRPGYLKQQVQINLKTWQTRSK